MKELSKIHFFDKNLHEIKKEILIDYGGEFEMVEKLSIDDQIRETHIRFRNFTDYESYINAIDQIYESEDVIFNGYIYKLSSLHFKLVNRSQYGNACDFKHEIFENEDIIYLLPTKGYCFVKCITFITG